MPTPPRIDPDTQITQSPFSDEKTPESGNDAAHQASFGDVNTLVTEPAADLQKTTKARTKKKSIPTKPEQSIGDDSGTKKVKYGDVRGSTTGSPIQELIRMLAGTRPDLVEEVMRIERDARSQINEKLRSELNSQQRRMDDLMTRCDKLIKSGEQNSDKQRLLIEAHQQQQFRLAEESKTAISEHKKDAERLRSERDGLMRELGTVRTQFVEGQQVYRQTESELESRLKKERLDFEERQKVSAKQRAALEVTIDELTMKVQSAVESRDCVHARVQELETKLEGVILPLRNQVDAGKAREAQLRRQLSEAQKKMNTLELLAHGPKDT